MVKVSVIVPTYNREKYILKALANLRSQTLDDIEFVLVDDGSQDGTQKLLKNETKTDRRFKCVFCKENKGPSYARNQGLKAASGEYVGFFDIDDHIPEDYFEILSNTAKDNKADIAFAATGENPKNLWEKLSLLRKGGVWDKIYLKELIDARSLAFEEGLFVADTLFTVQAIYYSKKMCLAPKARYDYSLKKDSIGYAKDNATKRKDDIFVVIKKIKDFALEKKFGQREVDALNAFMTRCFMVASQGKNFQQKLSYVLGAKEQSSPKRELWGLRIKKLFHLVSTKTYKERRATIMFKSSSLFDREWYLMQYPEARASQLEPEQHYYRIGWKKGFNPSFIFDGNAYLLEHKDVKDAGKNPLEHYLLSGRFEGRYYVAMDGKMNSTPAGGFQLPPKIEQHKTKTKLLDKIKAILEYPIYVQNEYERLMAEVKKLEQ